MTPEEQNKLGRLETQVFNLTNELDHLRNMVNLSFGFPEDHPQHVKSLAKETEQ